MSKAKETMDGSFSVPSSELSKGDYGWLIVAMAARLAAYECSVGSIIH
jgi:hypothetical protein